MIALIFAAAVVVAAADDVCICPAIYRPVCGSDGKTYPSSCSAGCAKVDVASQGKCKCTCPFNWSPVCGEDGKTYANGCEARCKEVKRFAQGACSAQPQNQYRARLRFHRFRTARPSPTSSPVPTAAAAPADAPQTCLCQEIYHPVCGSDRKTYDNECKATCAGVTSTAGACPPRAQQHAADAPPRAQQLPARRRVATRQQGGRCVCDHKYDPVCGANGVTYSNACIAGCRSQQVVRPGSC